MEKIFEVNIVPLPENPEKAVLIFPKSVEEELSHLTPDEKQRRIRQVLHTAMGTNLETVRNLEFKQNYGYAG